MSIGVGDIREVPVRTAAGADYPVLVGEGIMHRLPGLLERNAPAFRYALVSDDRVMELHGFSVLDLLRRAGLSVEALVFPAGEENKTRMEWSRLTDALLDSGFGRDGCVLALGGGVTGDLAGFVAATYMRGIPVVQLPTSLVAMVDASVGGKTGVDVPGGKNLVGAFHPPRFVLADIALTRTLPRRERSQGLAEAVKHGAILDETYFEALRDEAGALVDGEGAATTAMVARSVELKAGVVSRDEREGGLREILNFGHTLGHALEAASDYRLGHGSAVAMGMALEARLGEETGITAPGTGRQLERALEAVGLPVAVPDGLDARRVVDHLGRDKKARGGELRFVFLERIGTVRRAPAAGRPWSHPVSGERVRELLLRTP